MSITYKTVIFLVTIFSSTSFAVISIPTELKEIIRENTFLIVPINGYAPNLTVEQARERFSLKCLKSDLPVHQKLNCEVLESCQGDSCISEFANQGTAFLMNEGKELHTAWHVLFSTHAAGLVFAANYLETASEEQTHNIYKNFKPQFLLLDQNFNTVYDTRLEAETYYIEMGDPLSTVFSSNGKNKKGVYGYIENIPEDFVKVQLTRSLGNGFKKANPVDKSGLEGPFISAGFGYNKKDIIFSIETGGVKAQLTDLKRKMKNFMEFQLRALPVEREDFWKMSSEDQLVLMGYSRESAQEQIQNYPADVIESSIKTVVSIQARNERDLSLVDNERVLITTNPSLTGVSGGPLLNFNGEVVGIITNGFSSLDKESGVKIAHGSGARLY